MDTYIPFIQTRGADNASQLSFCLSLVARLACALLCQTTPHQPRQTTVCAQHLWIQQQYVAEACTMASSIKIATRRQPQAEADASLHKAYGGYFHFLLLL